MLREKDRSLRSILWRCVSDMFTFPSHPLPLPSLSLSLSLSLCFSLFFIALLLSLSPATTILANDKSSFILEIFLLSHFFLNFLSICPLNLSSLVPTLSLSLFSYFSFPFRISLSLFLSLAFCLSSIKNHDVYSPLFLSLSPSLSH